MPLIGKIQITLGIVFVVYCVIMYFVKKTKARKKGMLLINNVHVIDGNGNEAEGQNVLIKNGRFEKITSEPIQVKNVETIDGTGNNRGAMTLGKFAAKKVAEETGATVTIK